MMWRMTFSPLRRVVVAGTVAAVVAAGLAASVVKAQAPRAPNWTAIQDETMQHYQALLRFDTMDPPGKEAEAVAYLKQVLEKEGIPVQVFALEAHRPNLVARLKGNGRRKPMLLMAHTDVVLKLSRVEGMSGPPLEGFHRGATCILTPVTGHDEYLQHGWNGLLTGWDDPDGTARQLDLLARDRHLLHFLRTNAAATARAWPGWV